MNNKLIIHIIGNDESDESDTSTVFFPTFPLINDIVTLAPNEVRYRVIDRNIILFKEISVSDNLVGEIWIKKLDN